MNILFKITILAISMAMTAPAMALTATQTIQKEVVTLSADGTEKITYESAELVTPGERVLYSLNYENDQNIDATDLVLTMPVPDVIVYSEGSASGPDSIVTYSVDGQNFYARETLTVPLANGQARSAAAEDITHIRYRITRPVPPGESGSLIFSGTLK